MTIMKNGGVSVNKGSLYKKGRKGGWKVIKEGGRGGEVEEKENSREVTILRI